MMLFEFSIDLEKELTRLLGNYHIVVPKSIIKELEFLSKNAKGEKKTKAKTSLKLIERYDTINSNEKSGDDSILYFAQKTKGFVVTNDRELRNRLKEKSLSVIFLRARKKLVIE